MFGVQREIGTASGGSGNIQLNINYATVVAAEASDWELHSVLIWDSALSTATMKAVTAALREVGCLSLTLYLSLSLSLSLALSLSRSVGFSGATQGQISLSPSLSFSFPL